MQYLINNKFTSNLDIAQPPILTYVIPVDKDAMLLSGEDMLNYGDSTIMQTTNAEVTGKAATIYGFSGLKKIPVEVRERMIDANLSLNISGYNPSEHNVSLYKYYDDSWKEMIVTWFNAPSKGDFLSETAIKSHATSMKLDVSSSIKERIANSSDTIGFYINSPDANDSHTLNVYAKDYNIKSMRPSIVIRYYDIPKSIMVRTINGSLNVIQGPVKGDIDGTLTVDSSMIRLDITGTMRVPKFSAFTNTYLDSTGATLYSGIDDDSITKYEADTTVAKTSSTGDIEGSLIVVRKAYVPDIDGTVKVPRFSAFTHTYTNASNIVIYSGTDDDSITKYNSDASVDTHTSTGDITGTIDVQGKYTSDIPGNVIVSQPAPDKEITGSLTISGSVFSYTFKDSKGTVIYTGCDETTIRNLMHNSNVATIDSTGDLISGTVDVKPVHRNTIIGTISVAQPVNSLDIDGTLNPAVLATTYTFKNTKGETIYTGTNHQSITSYTKNIDTVSISTDMDIVGSFNAKAVNITDLNGTVKVWKGSAFTHTFYNASKVVTYTGIEVDDIATNETIATNVEHDSTGDIAGTLVVKAKHTNEITGTVIVKYDAPVKELPGTVIPLAYVDAGTITGTIDIMGPIKAEISGWLRNPPQDVFVTIVTGADGTKLYEGHDVDTVTNLVSSVPNIKTISSTGDINGAVNVKTSEEAYIDGTVIVKYEVPDSDIDGSLIVKGTYTGTIEGTVSVETIANDLPEITGSANVAAKKATWLTGEITVAQIVNEDLPGNIFIKGLKTIEITGTITTTPPAGAYAFIM